MEFKNLTEEFMFKLSLIGKEGLLGIIVMLDCMGSFVEYTEERIGDKELMERVEKAFDNLKKNRQIKLLRIIDEVMEDDNHARDSHTNR